MEQTGHACRSRTVHETLLEQVVLDAINRVLCRKKKFLKTLQENIASVIVHGDKPSPEVIEKRLEVLQKELLKKANQKADYNAIADEILRLRNIRKQSEFHGVIRDEQMKRINDLQDFIKSQPTKIQDFDKELVKRLISKITVFDDYFTVEFKSRITIDIQA